MQLIRVNGIESSCKPVTCKVSQGSILGPLIFIMYINSLPSTIQDTHTYLYADDMAIVTQGNDPDDIAMKLSVELSSANNWLTDHKLSLNTQKTKVMYFNTTQRLSNVNPMADTLDGVEIERVSTYNYMGLMLDQRLLFDSHVDYLTENIWPNIYTLYCIRKYISL